MASDSDADRDFFHHALDDSGADDVLLLPEVHRADDASSESSQLQLFVDNLSSEQLLQLSALIAAKLQTSSPAPAPPAAPADALVAPLPQPTAPVARSASASPFDLRSMMRLSLTLFFPTILLLMMHHQDLFSCCRVLSTKLLQQAPGSAPAPRATSGAALVVSV